MCLTTCNNQSICMCIASVLSVYIHVYFVDQSRLNYITCNFLAILMGQTNSIGLHHGVSIPGCPSLGAASQWFCPLWEKLNRQNWSVVFHNYRVFRQPCKSGSLQCFSISFSCSVHVNMWHSPVWWSTCMWPIKVHLEFPQPSAGQSYDIAAWLTPPSPQSKSIPSPISIWSKILDTFRYFVEIAEPVPRKVILTLFPSNCSWLLLLVCRFGCLFRIL